jgi:hypothetical protein
VLRGGEALAEWWRGRWSVALRWLSSVRDALRRAPAYLGERWNARERWVLMVSLLSAAAVLALWYSANQRGSSLPRGERTAVAAPLGETSPERLEAAAPTAPEPLPEAARAASAPAAAPEPSARELVAGSEALERRPAPSAVRERRRIQSSAAALRPSAAQPRQTSEAEPAPPSPPPSARRGGKPTAADPFADRL